MKNLFLSAIAVFTVGFANAQNVKFGAKAGLNLANISGGGDNSDFALRTSFYIGGVAEIKVSDKFAVQPELVYSSQGAKSKADSNSSLQLDYLNIPVMAKFIVADGFSLQAGPQVGILLSASSKNELGSFDVKKELSTVDFSLGLGAGYDISENFNVGARFNLGLSKINKESVTGGNDIKNTVIQIGVGYNF